MTHKTARSAIIGVVALRQMLIILAIVVAFASGGWAEPYLASGWTLLFAAVALGQIFFFIRPRPQAWLTSPVSFVIDVSLSLVLFAVIMKIVANLPPGTQGGLPLWALMVAAWLFAWSTIAIMSNWKPEGGWVLAQQIAIPALFGITILLFWEGITRGANVPTVLLPPPSMIWTRLVNSLPLLAADFQQTFLKAVLIGYALGCLSGFAVAILIDRSPFLKRGLLPLGNFVSALPIIGVAPIMVMWFGFDWPSKAAVVVVMTFFPMLVNTVAGLNAAGHMERDLMRTYAAPYWQTLLKLRLPAAAPLIFNALKINSTLALIGAIVAEFFGTPIVGMGFRISSEIGKLNVDMVWAEIAVAALAGSAFYGLVALIERRLTFWHPSMRGGRN